MDTVVCRHPDGREVTTNEAEFARTFGPAGFVRVESPKAADEPADEPTDKPADAADEVEALGEPTGDADEADEGADESAPKKGKKG